MQENVQCWLSPPDSYMNHFFARESHHHGTALWFAQGDVFKKWKTNGSLLWIHGIRTRISFSSSGIPDNLLRGSCIGQEYALVCVTILLVLWRTHLIYQFNNYPRYQSHLRNWVSHLCLFLL